MHDIDLIPREYRQASWFKTWFTHLLIFTATMLAVFVLSFVGLRQQTTSLAVSIQQLEQEQAITDQQRAKLEEVTRQRDAIGKQLSVLQSLRSGDQAQAVFRVIDNALADAEVWFLRWNFQRAGMVPANEPATQTEPAYFITLSDPNAATDGQPWLLETHMSINGQARDYRALSDFVDGLFATASVVDVKVQRSELSKRGSLPVVEFELAVVLKSEAKS